MQKMENKAKTNMTKILNKDFEINLDYIAGFFDGEGNVAIKVSSDKKRKYQTYFGGRVQIVQTNREILKKIKAFLGYGYVIERKNRNVEWRRSYFYQIQNEQELRDFINKMKNRTYRKHKQLLVLEDFLNERKERKTGIFYSKEDALKFIEYAERLQLLNDRNKITKHLKDIKQKITDFDEDEYLDKMKVYTTEKVKRLVDYSKEHLKIKIQKEELEKYYLQEKLSCPKIAKIYGCHKTTINRRLIEYGIPRRSPAEELELLRGKKDGKNT